MLAYVFWHWPRPGVAASGYEQSLRAFQSTLSDQAPPGLRESLVLRTAPLPWTEAKTACYEDWYVVAGSGALDPLNDVAVSPACRPDHDTAAAAAAGGTAGLYRHRLGGVDLPATRCAAWLSKPEGTSYDAFFEWAKPRADAVGASLWGRQMTLGPTPEFVFLGPERPALPAAQVALDVSYDVVWCAS